MKKKLNKYKLIKIKFDITFKNDKNTLGICYRYSIFQFSEII